MLIVDCQILRWVLVGGWRVHDLPGTGMQSSLLPSPLALHSWNPSCKLVLSNYHLPPLFSRETMGGLQRSPLTCTWEQHPLPPRSPWGIWCWF